MSMIGYRKLTGRDEPEHMRPNAPFPWARGKTNEPPDNYSILRSPQNVPTGLGATPRNVAKPGTARDARNDSQPAVPGDFAVGATIAKQRKKSGY